MLKPRRASTGSAAAGADASAGAAEPDADASGRVARAARADPRATVCRGEAVACRAAGASRALCVDRQPTHSAAPAASAATFRAVATIAKTPRKRRGFRAASTVGETVAFAVGPANDTLLGVRDIRSISIASRATLESMRGVRGATALVLLCTAFPARAESPCTTRTARDSSDIVVPQTRHIDAANGPVVRVVQGETLCLEPTLHGQRLDLRIVHTSADAIRVSLRYRKGRSVLELTNPGPWPLWHEARFQPNGQEPILPGRTAHVGWKGWSAGVTLYGFRTKPTLPDMKRGEGVVERGEGVVPSERALAERGRRPFWLSLSGIVAVHHQRQSALVSEFRKSGYAAPALDQPMAGMLVEAGWARWRFAFEDTPWGFGRYEKAGGGKTHGFQSYFVALYGGWDVLQYRGLAVFPMLGIAGSGIQVSYDSRDPPLLRSQLSKHPSSSTVESGAGALAGLIGIEERVPISPLHHAYLVLSTRIGWAWQFARSGWDYTEGNDPSPSGGPPIDTGGAFLGGSVGIVGSRL